MGLHEECLPKRSGNSLAHHLVDKDRGTRGAVELWNRGFEQEKRETRIWHEALDGQIDMKPMVAKLMERDGHMPGVPEEINRISETRVEPSGSSLCKTVHPPKNVLIVVDIQYDFFEGGALPVVGARRVADAIKQLLTQCESLPGFESHLGIFFAQDWHPLNHWSFDVNNGPYKPHCIMNTHGAEIHPCIRGSIAEAKVKTIRFGRDAHLAGYSPFENPQLDNATDWTKVTRVFVVGLALEYCVQATCWDAKCRAINGKIFTSRDYVGQALEKDEAVWNRLASEDVSTDRDAFNKNWESALRGE